MVCLGLRCLTACSSCVFHYRFNYRATRVLVNEGFYEFWNWFDKTAWYPLGRVVGGTVYPGLSC